MLVYSPKIKIKPLQPFGADMAKLTLKKLTEMHLAVSMELAELQKRSDRVTNPPTDRVFQRPIRCARKTWVDGKPVHHTHTSRSEMFACQNSR